MNTPYYPNTLFILLVFCLSISDVFCQSCDCNEYIYLNEVSSNGRVHKFSVAMDGSVAELFSDGSSAPSGTPPPPGAGPWYPGTGTSELPFPHGLSVDLNGFLYIGERAGGNLPASGVDIRRLTCDGTITPETGPDGFVINLSGELFNIASFNNVIYTNGEDQNIYAWDPCTGNSLGFVNVGATDDADDWGFHINPNTGTFYATRYRGTSADIGVYVFTPTLADFSANTTFPVTISRDLTNFGIGQPYVFSSRLQGVTSDPAGNIYVVEGSVNQDSRLLKFSPTGLLLQIGPSDNVNDGMGWNDMIGVVYSETSNRLYTSSLSAAEPCLISWDADDITAAPVVHINPVTSLGQAKGIAISNECCPTQDLILTETICGLGGGVVFLQDVLDCGDGIICEGMWSVETANSNQIFNDCDLSITVNGSGCGTYVLEKTTGATGSQQCGAFRIELEVCTEIPEAMLSVAMGTCNGENPNNDASININGVMSAGQANFSAGSSYNGPDYNGPGSVDISGGTGSITDLMHNTEYTVRVFNGSNDCFVDYTITTPDISCMIPCEIDAISMTSNQCVDNSTPGNPTDDRVQVGIMVTGLGSTYTLSVDGGTTITPSSGTIGSPSSFMLGEGTAGSGNTYTITIEDAADPSCNQTLVVQAPENCDTVLPCPTADCGGVTIQKNE